MMTSETGGPDSDLFKGRTEQGFTRPDGTELGTKGMYLMQDRESVGINGSCQQHTVYGFRPVSVSPTFLV
jgi:hypothetical protein